MSREKKTKSGAEFAGRVESIEASGTGGCRFVVESRKNGNRTYRVDGAASAMISMAVAAHAAGSKVHVTGAAANGEAALAEAIRIGAKPQEPAKPRAKKPKAAPAEAAAVPAA
jgi:hypothetical protein